MGSYHQLLFKQYQSHYNRIALQFYFMDKLELHVAHIASVRLLKIKKGKAHELNLTFCLPRVN